METLNSGEGKPHWEGDILVQISQRWGSEHRKQREQALQRHWCGSITDVSGPAEWSVWLQQSEERAVGVKPGRWLGIQAFRDVCLLSWMRWEAAGKYQHLIYSLTELHLARLRNDFKGGRTEAEVKVRGERELWFEQQELLMDWIWVMSERDESRMTPVMLLVWITGKIRPLFSEEGEEYKRSTFGREGQGSGFGLAELRVLIRHFSGAVKETDTLPEFRGKAWD